MTMIMTMIAHEIKPNPPSQTQTLAAPPKVATMDLLDPTQDTDHESHDRTRRNPWHDIAILTPAAFIVR